MSLPKQAARLFFRYSQSLSMRIQFLLLYGVLFTALAVSTSWFVYTELQSANRHQADTIGSLLSSQTAKAATDMLVTGDRLSLTVLLNQLVQNPYVARAAIYSIDNREIASSESDKIGDSGDTYSSPIHYQDAIAGYVRLQLDQQLLTQNPDEALTLIITISFILLIGGLILINLYSSVIVERVTLIERQLYSVLQAPTSHNSTKNELSRLGSYVEKQLTEKLKSLDTPEPEVEEEEISAILSVKNKNLGRLRQLLAPHELMKIIDTHADAVDMAAEQYNGQVSYTPDGSCYIRFSSKNSETFSIDALSCGLLIESLNRVIDEQNVADLEVGLGLCLSDGMSDFPGEHHPSKADSAAGNALMLAMLPGVNQLCMFREQLNWLPADMLDITSCQDDSDIVEISSADDELSDIIQEQAYTISRELERE